jgi:MFS family permease
MQTTNNNETFWNRDFIIALAGSFFLSLSINLFLLFPLYLKQFNPSKSRVGLIMGIHSLMAILVRPIFGYSIEVKGRRKIALLGICLLIATMPWFHLVKNAGFFPLLLRALTGIGWGIGLAATMTLCSDLAPREKLANSLGIIGVAGLLANALGPLLGEETINTFGFGGLFNLSVISLLVSFLCIFVTKDVVVRDPSKKFPKPKSLRNISFLSLLFISSMPIFHGATKGSIDNFIALFGKSILIHRIGPFFLAFSTAAILTRLRIGDISDRYGRKQVIFPAVCIISLNLILISSVKSFWVFVLSGFIGGFGQGLIFPALSTYMIDILGRDNKGLALSLYLSLFDMGTGIGSPFFGWVSDLFGYRKMYLSAGILLFLISILFTFKAPSSELEK